MNYIINPSWFYWLNVLDALKVTTFVSIILCTAGVVILTIFAIVYYTDGYRYRENDPDWKMYLKLKSIILKILLPALIVFLLVGIFIPGKQTLIEMQVARFATYENAEWTLDTVKAAVDYIIESIKSVR